jgi:predicted nucleic acid-binding protein
VRFWDSSALLPLFVRETHSPAVEALVADDPAIIVWWAAHVECGSAVHRLRREGAFTPAEAAQLLTRLTAALGAAEVVQPGEELSAVALRLLANHPLRAADALQLAAALVWARGRPAGRELVCLDEQLSTAAILEGFTVLPAAGRT